MTSSVPAPRQQYLSWIEEQIEDFKETISRDELLQIADEAIVELENSPDGQISLTEIVLADAVDRLIFLRLRLPTYRQWLRACQNDTQGRPPGSTSPAHPSQDESR